jgi:Protein of unknown function (DUF4019)
VKRLLFFAACIPALAGCGLFEGVDTAEKAAVVFHAQYDAGRFDEMYDGSAEDLRANASRDDFMTTMTSMRKRLGPIRATERSAFNARVDSQGTFVALEYETDFEGGSGTETFTWEVAGGRAKLLSYNVTSNALLR